MSSGRPIQYYNRYRESYETEAVFGEKWLRWAYENPLGLMSTRLVVSRKWVSSWYGKKMSAPKSREKIAPFIEQYGVDVSEFAESVESFQSFNDFFKRELKSSARPIEEDERCVIFPADGRHLVFPDLDRVSQVFVKGQRWCLTDLIKRKEWIDRYRGGSLVLSRLCPLDYHHFHFPVAGLPRKPVVFKGPLYSVNPIALRKNLNYLVGNYRQLTEIEETRFGNVLMIEVGATMVGSIVQSFESEKPVLKGGRKGWFEFGGSSVITLFERGKVAFSEDLVRESEKGFELYGRMGDVMGKINS